MGLNGQHNGGAGAEAPLRQPGEVAQVGNEGEEGEAVGGPIKYDARRDAGSEEHQPAAEPATLAAGSEGAGSRRKGGSVFHDSEEGGGAAAQGLENNG